MSVYGFFQPSVLGMESQSHALSVIGTNIANVRTGGFKRTDVHFETVLSRSFTSQPGSTELGGPLNTQSDIGGVVPKNYNRVTLQGEIENTDRNLDIAINGRGFFVLNSSVDSDGRQVYGRDGSFGVNVGPEISVTSSDGNALTVNEGYLADKNGLYVQGWEANPDGSFPSDEGSLTSIRVDPYAFTSEGKPTTAAALSVNLPANTAVGDSESFSIDVFDSGGNRQDIRLGFVKTATPNVWDLAATGAPGDTVTVTPSQDATVSTTPAQETIFTAATGTIAVQGAGGGAPAANFFATLATGDVITISGSVSNNGTYTVGTIAPDGSSITVDPLTPIALDETNAAATAFSGLGSVPLAMTFRPDGYISTPSDYTFSIAHAGGETSDFSLDVSSFSQFAGVLTPFTYERNGFPPGDLASVRFNANGDVVGVFDNGHSENLYRLALADFTNGDGLFALSGNVYAESPASGTARFGVPGDSNLGQLSPAALETSNVDLSQEFTKMIITQNAYNSSATAFRTADEMTETARDLKR